VARSLDLILIAATAVIVGAASLPAALAAPATAEEKAARKKAREEKRDQKKPEKQDKPAKDKPAKDKPAKDRPAKDKPTTDKPAKQAKQPSAPSVPLPACPPDNTLTWRSFGGGFLLTWCTGCHSSHLAADARQDAPTDINFDTHAAFKPHASLVYERAVLEAHAFIRDPNTGSPMPPAGLPPESDRQRLTQWIACGAPLP
jgi:Sec-independent protein translocase protein TatA